MCETSDKSRPQGPDALADAVGQKCAPPPGRGRFVTGARRVQPVRPVGVTEVARLQLQEEPQPSLSEVRHPHLPPAP
jgi:hypothetical protein